MDGLIEVGSNGSATRDFRVTGYDPETRELVIRMSVDVADDEVLPVSSSGKSLHVVNVGGKKFVAPNVEEIPARLRGKPITIRCGAYIPNDQDA